METTFSVTLESGASFDEFVEELVAALAKHGLEFVVGPDGNVTFGDGEVGRVPEWGRHHALIRWRATDWDRDDVCDVELRADGECIRVECRGFGRQFWSAEDLVGWFADQAVAPVLGALVPARFGDWLTDRAARRPFGVRARRDYRDPSHHRPSFGAVFAALELRPDDVLLEIGSGGGAFLQQALQSGCRAVGVDHSPEMVRAARELNAEAVEEGRLDILEGDAASLPFAAETFTCAAMMQVFFFLPDPAAVLRDVHRVLRPAGRLAVFTVSELARGTPAAPEPMASRAQFYSDDELVALAHDAHFAEARVEHPDLEQHALAAGLPDDVVELFRGAAEASQLLIARRS